MKILLAEDDLNISTIAKLSLETLGTHEVTVVHDGEAALNEAINNNYDLILLDEMMPKMNGLSVCRTYKLTKTDHSPIIFLSAKSQDDDINEFNKCGLGFIPKPFDPTLLCGLIDKLLLESKQEKNT